MLIESFEQIESQSLRPELLVRGRGMYFWKRKMFKDVEPYDPAKGAAGFHYLIVFDPQRFLATTPTGIDEILSRLHHRDPEKENIFSVEGKPFFALSRGTFNKLGMSLESQSDVTQRLRNNGNVRIVELQNRFDVLDVRQDWGYIEHIIKNFQAEELRSRGVVIEDMGNFYIEGILPIGVGTQIATGVVIKGSTRIGENVRIYPNCYLENAVIGNNCILLPGSIVMDSVMEDHVQIGPYTHLRNGAVVKSGAKMGNFVEMKKSTLGEGSKAMHLSYLGDADIGQKVNIGAGTITCNYDGVNKNKTIIEDGVFIGSGTELVAPVAIRQNSYVGAGSTITKEVPPDTLAIARQAQRNILDWVTRKKNKNTPGS